MTALGELLTSEAIALEERVEGWEEAIGAAGRLLEATGVADAGYTEAMVRSVHDHGPYIVLAPGFALAHARPSEAVHRTGVSWVRLASPVEFGHATNDPVTLVVALAATDSSQHQGALASLAALIGDPTTRAALDAASSPDEVLALVGGEGTATAAGPETRAEAEPEQEQRGAAASSATQGSTRNHILTVCGNGLGTSLFLKNTLEQVLDRWGWGRLVTVEATDTVSARGKAKDADLIFTSGEIARALGDVGVPLRVIENFTSKVEIDTALREMYDV